MATMTLDQLVVLIDAQTGNLKKEIAAINNELNGMSKQATKSTSKMQESFDRVGKAAATALKVGVVGAIAAVSASIPAAVRRIDTLNNSARTFENMGFKTQDADKAVKELVDSITGLPTPLDSAMRGMTALAATYGDVNKGQQVFTALNNAILGFGGSAEMVDNALMQLSQLPMDGALDAQTWNSLRNSGLTPVLVAMGKDMGMSVAQLKEAFGSGQLTVEDFTTSLIKLNTEGGGGLKSLEEIARDSTAGIGTGFANMQTAIVRGVAAVIEAIGSENISNAITNIGKGFEDALKSLVAVIEFIRANKGVFGTLAVVIGTATASILAYNVAAKAFTIVSGTMAVATTYLTLAASLQAQGLGVLRAAWLALNIMMAANPIGLVIVAVSALTAGLVYFATQTEVGRRVFETAMNGIKIAASVAWNFIKAVFSPVASYFGSQFSSAYNRVAAAFNLIKVVGTATWNALSSGARNAVNTIGSIAGNIVAPFRNAFRSIASLWNNTVGRINFKAPDWVPGMGGKGFSVPKIPMLAQGGIVTAPTLAMIGEGGQSEAVIPLDKLEKMGGSNHIIVNIGEDTIVDRIVKGINNKSFMGNTSVLDI